jgi:hypothetical protein
MPRLYVRLDLVDDQNNSIFGQGWSPLGYEDFNNPDLFVAGDSRGLLVSDSERDLLERLRTSIDRTLLRFARGERRRHEVRRNPIQVDEVVADFTGEDPVVVNSGSDHDLLRPRTIAELLALTPEERHQAIQTSSAEDLLRVGMFIGPNKDQFGLQVTQKEENPVVRVSRYERKPVI